MLDISHNNTTKESTLQVVIYSKENGETPFRDFLKCISPKMRTKVLWTIELLKEKGIELINTLGVKAVIIYSDLSYDVCGDLDFVRL